MQCSARHLNDNHGGPCYPPGIRRVDALVDAQESLARIAASGKSGPTLSLLDRLHAFIDRHVAEQQNTFSRVRAYKDQMREVVDILTAEDGASLTDRGPFFDAKIEELPSFPDDKTYNEKLTTTWRINWKPVSSIQVIKRDIVIK